MCSETFVIDILNQIILAQDILILFLCSGMATPLRPFDLRELVENSLAWAVLHPGERARDLPKEHRVASTLARAAYSVATRATDAPDLGSRHLSVPAVWCVDPQLVRVVPSKRFGCLVPQL